MSAISPLGALAPASFPSRSAEWKVTLEFRKGPAFSINASAPNMETAIRLGKFLAESCGFTDEVRHAKAVRV